MFRGPFSESIIARAIEKKILKLHIYNLRDWATDKRKTVDDKPYGGGPGMILKVDVLDRALCQLKTKTPRAKSILLTPGGKLFNQKKAIAFSKLPALILICGHYEGVDARASKLVDEEISIGDYVLTGGEIPAMVLIDAVARLIPGVLEKKETTQNESFSLSSSLSTPLLEYPQYTRPFEYKGMKVPKVLLSGDHKKISEWRLKKSIQKTKKTRPQLLKENQ